MVDGSSDLSRSVLSGFPPKVYLIGAQKCATTFFAECIAAHPDIELSAPKEPHFYSRDMAADFSSYRRCFDDPDSKILLDASPSYSYSPSNPTEQRADNPRYGVAGRIKKATPNAKFIYIVRDPVERTWSSYWHAVRSGDEELDFGAAIERRSGYLDASRYHFQLQQYLEVFDYPDILVLQMKDVTQDPSRTLKLVWEHLGVEAPGEIQTAFQPRNASYRFNTAGRILAGNKASRELLKITAQGVRAVLPFSAYAKLRGLLSKEIPEMSSQQKEAVRRALEHDVRRFVDLTGLTFKNFPSNSRVD